MDVPHNDALITIDIANCTMQRFLVDIGSSSDIIFYDAFKKIGIPKKVLKCWICGGFRRASSSMKTWSFLVNISSSSNIIFCDVLKEIGVFK